MPLKDPVARKAYAKDYTERTKEKRKEIYEQNKENIESTTKKIKKN
jgi:hypothetical protein